MIFSELQTALSNRLGLPAVGDALLTPTSLAALINEALGVISTERMWWWLLTDVTFQFNGGVATLPTDLVKIEAIQAYGGLIEPVSRRDLIDSDYVELPSPVGWTTVGNQVRLAPAPAGLIAGRMFYYRTETTLVAGSDLPAMPVAFHGVIIAYAAYLAHTRRQDPVRAQAATLEYQAWLKRMVDDQSAVKGPRRVRIGRDRAPATFPSSTLPAQPSITTGGVIVCTSSTRPTGVDGQLILETDTDRLLEYDATLAAWVPPRGVGYVAPSGSPPPISYDGELWFRTDLRDVVARNAAGGTWDPVSGGGVGSQGPQGATGATGLAGAGGVIAYTATLNLSAVTAQATIATVTFPAVPGRRYQVSGYVNYTKTGTADGVNIYLYDGATQIAYGAEVMVLNAYAVTTEVATFATGGTARTATVTMQMATPTGAVTPARGYLMVTDVGDDTQVGTPSAIVAPNVWNTGWGEVARGTNTTPQAGISADVDVVTATFTAYAGRRYRYTYALVIQASATAGIWFMKITDAANTQLQASQTSTSGASYYSGNIFVDDLTGTAGSRTIKGRTSTSVTTATTVVSAILPALLIIEDMGPIATVAPDTWPPNPLPGPWTAPTLTNSWANTGGSLQTARYRKVGDIVYLEGCIQGGAFVNPALTLPTGYRPPLQIQRPAWSAASVAAGLAVTNLGLVYIQYGNVAAATDIGCSFSTV